MYLRWLISYLDLPITLAFIYMYISRVRSQQVGGLPLRDILDELKNGLGIPPLGLPTFEPAHVGSLLGEAELDIFVGFYVVHWHWLNQHHLVIFGGDEESAKLKFPDLFLSYFEFIEDGVDGFAEYLLCDALVEFLEVGALEHVIVVDDIVFPPEFHLLVPDYHCLQVVLDKILLVLHVHVVDHVFHVERRTH